MQQQSSPPGNSPPSGKKVTKEAPDAEKVTGSFKSAEGSKEVIIDPGSSEGKMVRIGTTLSPE